MCCKHKLHAGLLHTPRSPATSVASAKGLPAQLQRRTITRDSETWACTQCWLRRSCCIVAARSGVSVCSSYVPARPTSLPAGAENDGEKPSASQAYQNTSKQRTWLRRCKVRASWRVHQAYKKEPQAANATGRDCNAKEPQVQLIPRAKTTVPSTSLPLAERTPKNISLRTVEYLCGSARGKNK
ncbi:hypothetical protein EJ02DRAFT_105404 [Clathrospora elynae]|uniref:Uncharacterized protein n=1 Tax=Clathrospora elynae TaxID=706981 RepID=A0A6A5SX23_9PLEO|nr:hypothetical protein EJ02DRAFT_105404 [Clathrospora elynae]